MADYRFTESDTITPEMMLIAMDIASKTKTKLAAVVLSIGEWESTDNVKVGAKLEGRCIVVFKGSLVFWVYQIDGQAFRGSNADAEGVPTP